MKKIDKELLTKAGKDRFLSDYHYAVYEYYRSTKIIKEFDIEGIDYAKAMILDDGCGSGGITVSLGEESALAVGIDISPKFKDAAVKLSNELKIDRAKFIQSDGCALPFKNDVFDLIISHSVIEHVNDPLNYLHEACRILKPGGILFLETPPYYSFEGTHLPKPAFPIPFQLFIPRTALYRIYLFIGKRWPGFFRDGRKGSALFCGMERGERPRLEELNKMRIGKIRRLVGKTQLSISSEKLYHPSGFDKIFPGFIISFLKRFPLTRNFVVNTYKIFLLKTRKAV
jgi:SAM-dependent methyltransferase